MNALFNVLELRNVTKRFGSVTAIDDVSLSVEKGSIISLLGPSGCGKTTLLRIIAGFEDPDQGEVLLGSKNMVGKRPYERNVGLLFQDYALFPHMTVQKNVSYGLRQRGADDGSVKKRTAEMLNLVGMSDFVGRYPQNLSGGQQQRVALGRALANNPELVLLDEPLSALDAKLRLELRTELKHILKSAGSTAVVVTHDQEEAMTLGESVVVMDRGKIMQAGTPAQIYEHPQTRFVAEFVGRSNWFTGTLSDKVGAYRQLLCKQVGTLLIPEPKAGHNVYDACIRPEFIDLRARSESARDSERGPVNAIHGIIKDIMYLGADLEFIVTLEGGQEINVIERNGRLTTRQRGDLVALSFTPSDLIVIGRE
jgi:ABC-type Fe3+/spermidine/putrescine transport system ATPase subunit